ncbi:hypothetical protein ASPWEDRAFT_498378 [Aspergillus wentii DTO 134E9]|uniref:Uncharacterized protein n=1 Tax=Aspergillus wentii DTO 134E9 TaxID=1073089 RepID=A0A1L9RJX1_ASPWE|nr:uncharacterized protein ASPWEDRAFT_498378 [Aspergillus wentii DTO 134E9]OJJ35201.1 hypothetical protein ASPWEDRAFT_498378 [Aspergillus wentii DTO 134E9]
MMLSGCCCCAVPGYSSSCPTPTSRVVCCSLSLSLSVSLSCCDLQTFFLIEPFLFPPWSPFLSDLEPPPPRKQEKKSYGPFFPLIYPSSSTPSSCFPSPDIAACLVSSLPQVKLAGKDIQIPYN